MPADQPVLVASEDQLWDILEAQLSDTEQIPGTGFSISGWGPELLYLPEEPIGHSVSPSVARAITDFHRSLSRSYAYLAYGQANAIFLRQDDRELLDVRFVVTDGSSGLEVADWIIDTLIAGLIGKMTGDHITVATAVFLVLYFTHSYGKHWISKRYEEKRQAHEAEERERLGAQEIRRMEILSDVLTKHPHLKPLQDGAEDAKMGLVNAARNFNRSRVQGANLTAQEAKIIVSRQREERKGRRIDGLFEISRINPEHEAGHLFRLSVCPAS